jgi:hypothetical protein
MSSDRPGDFRPADLGKSDVITGSPLHHLGVAATLDDMSPHRFLYRALGATDPATGRSYFDVRNVADNGIFLLPKPGDGSAVVNGVLVHTGSHPQYSKFIKEPGGVADKVREAYRAADGGFDVNGKPIHLKGGDVTEALRAAGNVQRAYNNALKGILLGVISEADIRAAGINGDIRISGPDGASTIWNKDNWSKLDTLIQKHPLYKAGLAGKVFDVSNIDSSGKYNDLFDPQKTVADPARRAQLLADLNRDIANIASGGGPDSLRSASDMRQAELARGVPSAVNRDKAWTAANGVSRLLANGDSAILAATLPALRQLLADYAAERGLDINNPDHLAQMVAEAGGNVTADQVKNALSGIAAEAALSLLPGAAARRLFGLAMSGEALAGAVKLYEQAYPDNATIKWMADGVRAVEATPLWKYYKDGVGGIQSGIKSALDAVWPPGATAPQGVLPPPPNINPADATKIDDLVNSGALSREIAGRIAPDKLAKIGELSRTGQLPDYIAFGIRARAQELATLELGPETELERIAKRANEIGQERLTSLDRTLIRRSAEGVVVVTSPERGDGATHTQLVGRLRKLESLGLAAERRTGVWALDPELDGKLRRLGERADKIKMMQRALAEVGLQRAPGTLAVFDRSSRNAPLIGKVVGTGLIDEISDRSWVVVDGTDGRVHYVELGRLKPETVPPRDAIVRVVGDRPTGKPQSTPRLELLSRGTGVEQASYDGPLWVDRLVVDGVPGTQQHRGYGAELTAMIDARRAWLVGQDLGRFRDNGRFEVRHSAVIDLRRREVARIGAEIARETGLRHVPVAQGATVRGTVGRAIETPDGRYLAITSGREIRLVPWSKPLARHQGQEIAGTMGVKQLWIGRQRGRIGPER